MITESSGHMHFSGSGAEEVEFGRSALHLYLNTDGNATISFDGGNNFMPLENGDHRLLFANVKSIQFGAGTWSGVAISY